ncbi:MAG TPA: ABC transporter ATP-binding protein, partial [Lacipirellulaceae bacterium]|nr:ABC transporter ATP-binding protein [Lacipirellulaceae bacterium]
VTLGDDNITDHCLTEASDFLAQLTNGGLRRLVAPSCGRSAHVVNQHGETVPVGSLAGEDCDRVYLSLCLALLSAASRHGVWLPLVLDEPFERLDARGTAALAAVLEGFSRRGHQVLVFTRQKEAAERLASVGADTHDIFGLRQSPAETLYTNASEAHSLEPSVAPHVSNASGEVKTARRRRKKKSASRLVNGDSAEAGRSDAA